MTQKTDFRPTIYSCYLGYITQAIIVNLPPLFFVIFQNDFGVSYTQLGTLIFFTFVVQICVDATMVKYLSKVGYRAAAVIAHVFAAVGLILLGILPQVMPSYPGLLISAFFYSIGGGMIEVAVSPIIDSLPEDDSKASAMSLLHSFYCWGQAAVIVLTTIVLKFIGNDNWRYIPFVWAILPVITLICFTKVPLVPMTEAQKDAKLSTFVKSPVFLIMFLLMVCSGASEQAMAQWASLFAEEALGITKVLGDLMGPTMFALCMAVGRMYYGVKGGAKLNVRNALLLCGTVSVIAYCLAVFPAAAFINMIGCAICGFGVSLMWPATLQLASNTFGEKAGPAMFSLLALGGDIGCSVGPWLTGRVSDVYTSIAADAENVANSALKAGLAVAMIFPIAMIILILVLRKGKKAE